MPALSRHINTFNGRCLPAVLLGGPVVPTRMHVGLANGLAGRASFRRASRVAGPYFSEVR